MSSEKLGLRLREYAEWQINAFLWISLITITLVLLKKVVKLFKLWHHASKIPGPPCSSFYGHRHLLSSQTLTEVLAESHEKYGSVVRLWLGPTKLLVSIKKPALIKEILSKAEDKLPLTGRVFGLAFGQSNLFVFSMDQIYSEFIMGRKGSEEKEQLSIDNMHLLLATIYESFRLLPAGPPLQRCSPKHEGAEEYVDPRQSSFILNDPNDNASFLPFGSGSHACVGQRFVTQGVAALFASLLENHEIRLELGSGKRIQNQQ